MSKWIEMMPDGTIREEIADPDQCRWLCNEVCCNYESPCLADYPMEGECEKCWLYEKEEL